MQTYINPKTGDAVESSRTLEEAVTLLEQNNKTDFAQSLCQQFRERGLSVAQRFWLMKLSNEIVNRPEPIELKSDILPLLKRTKALMWKVSEDTARIKLYLSEDETYVKIFHSGGDKTRFAGKIIDDKFYPQSQTHAGIVAAQILAFSIDPKLFLMAVGKEWGRCCICGRTLENEESVKLGIGPICMERAFR